MLCLDQPELLDFKGQFIASEGSYIGIELKKCQDKPHCKSDEEIHEFVAVHRINLIFNSQHYDSGKYGEDEIIKDRLTSQYIYMNPATPKGTMNEI